MATVASLETKIEAHYDHPIRGEMRPGKTDSKAKRASYDARMARWNAELDALTDALRAARTQIAGPTETERLFPNDIANAEAAARFETLKHLQLEGVLKSCSRS